MPLQTSGEITLNDIHVEAGGSSGTQASLNDTDIRALIGKSSGAQMAFNEWYGASAITSENITDLLTNTTYRCYIESRNRGDTGKRAYSGGVDGNNNETATSFCYGSLAYRYNTSVVVDLAWGAIPSGWGDIDGSTIIFWHYAANASASTNGFHTDSGGTTRSISLTDYYMNVTYGEVHAGFFSSNSSTYNLNNATIGATFNKSSSNTHNGQRIIGIPGKWTYVTHGVAGTGSSTTVSCQDDDLVIVFSASNGNSCYFHSYQDTTNLSRLGATNLGRWSSHSNFTMYKTTSTSFSLRGSVSPLSSNAAYFVIRYTG